MIHDVQKLWETNSQIVHSDEQVLGAEIMRKHDFAKVIQRINQNTGIDLKEFSATNRNRSMVR